MEMGRKGGGGVKGSHVASGDELEEHFQGQAMSRAGEQGAHFVSIKSLPK